MARKRKTKRAPSREVPPHRRKCGTMAAHMSLLEKDPSFRARQFRIEQEFARRRASPVDLKKVKLTHVKVVVNVVHHTDAQDVSLAQIRSQIAVLNRDYGARNPDRAQVPEPWKGLVTDIRIRFRLAKVTRTRTDVASFTYDDAVKQAPAGIAPYRPTTHLNLWVCPLGGGLLGYAQFPGGPVSTDGAVINYQAFGTQGTTRSPFDGGRTATHEVGHYFNLRHIWGDTEDCSGTDYVPDTPNCAGPNYGTPTFPTVTCNNGPNGDMFMNYMDYVDDAAMFMFTAQQALRMRSTLEGPRSALQ